MHGVPLKLFSPTLSVLAEDWGWGGSVIHHVTDTRIVAISSWLTALFPRIKTHPLTPSSSVSRLFLRKCNLFLPLSTDKSHTPSAGALIPKCMLFFFFAKSCRLLSRIYGMLSKNTPHFHFLSRSLSLSFKLRPSSGVTEQLHCTDT